jgi:hypothetical protein
VLSAQAEIFRPRGFSSHIHTYIDPETGKSPRETTIHPFVYAGKCRVYSPPACRCREVVLESFDDERGVAVEFAADGEDGDFAV